MKRLTLGILALLAMAAASADVGGAAQKMMVGTWLRNGTDKSTKFVFNKDGTFKFFGPNATSNGKWSTDGASVKLVWTKIDKDVVAPGKVKGNFAMTEDGALKINTFLYRKKA
jgi:hypothetical protein